MPDLPHGTVTFAFTDVEGSTTLLKHLGDRYGAVLATHRRLVRDAFRRHGGVEIDTQGDAFFFAFERARDAVAAAADVQRTHSAEPWPEHGAVRVRIGLHTGEPTLGEEGYLGLDVVRAARLCGTCPGGHVLLSEATRALVGAALPEGVAVFPLGERHLKDIDEPERVFELEITGADVPPAERAPTPDGTPRGARAEHGRPAETALEEEIEQLATELTTRATEQIRLGFSQALSELGTKPGAAAAGAAPTERSDLDALVADVEGLGRRLEEELRRGFGDAADR